ncbi:hypothetical protein Taro_043401, partial [Colocasia esculenta]|nr:hypothetical protein [Colocasia esculenta]
IRVICHAIDMVGFIVVDLGYASPMADDGPFNLSVGGEGRVEELLVAEELWNDHKKLFFFPFSSAVTCTNRPLEVDQRRRPYEGDGPIGRVLRSCRDSIDRRVLKATKRSVATLLPDLIALLHTSHNPVAFWPRPIATLTGVCRDLTPGLTALSLSLYVPVAISGFCIKPPLTFLQT